VRIDVFRKASGEAERALAQGWHASDGPYPTCGRRPRRPGSRCSSVTVVRRASRRMC
jgi:hypothetical protein